MLVSAEKLAERCIAISVVTGALLTIAFWGSWLTVVVLWISVLPLAFVLAFIVGFLCNLMGMTVADAPENPAENELVGSFWVDDKSEYEKSETVVGRFRDAEIYEWIMLTIPDTGEKIKLYWDRAIHDASAFEPPEERWYMLVEPGILYVEALSSPELAPVSVPA